jgi:HEAT repeat protein
VLRACLAGVALLTVLVPGGGPKGPGRAQRADVRTLADELSAADPVVRGRAACALRDLGESAAPAIPSLVALLADGAPIDRTACPQQWRRADSDLTTPGELAAAALVAIGARSVDPLLAAVRSSSPTARRHAAWALGALDDPRAEQPLVALLRDAEPRVREQAAWALGALDSLAAVTPLTGALKDAAPKVRAQAAWALGAIDDADAVPALIGALRDDEASVRSQAAWALGAIGDRRALAELLAALKDREPEVRRHAAWAIGVIGG